MFTWNIPYSSKKEKLTMTKNIYRTIVTVRYGTILYSMKGKIRMVHEYLHFS